ncbi:MAG: carboxypeptidase-like regulatory domain-containing protein [bacterium]|nr:carboxypeptidase-like regulatory domain-containing protein [bacterium]
MGVIRPPRLLVLILLTLLLPATAQNAEVEGATVGPAVFVSGQLQDADGNPVAGAAVEFTGLDAVLTTDEGGFFKHAKLSEGAATVRCTIGEDTTELVTPPLTAATAEHVIHFYLGRDYILHLYTTEENPYVAGKPNIYLYPEAEADVRVWLSFVGAGRMTTSEPEYLEGWDVTITPEGRITAYEPVYFLDPDTGEHWPIPARGEPAGEYDYLFYEGEVAGPGQLDYGWVVDRDEIEPFFREKLAAYGFAGREIEDFLEFWAPRLTDYPLFAVYPQVGTEYEKLVSLGVFPAPDSVLRVVFTIRGSWEKEELAPTEPAIAPFERRGFTVVEWGVILKQSDAKVYLH